MDILVIGDLHGVSIKIDVLKIPDIAIQLGDLSNYGEPDIIENLISELVTQLDPVPLLVIPGNHDIYGLNDIFAAFQRFNKLVKRAGAIPLMEGPLILEEIGIVGVPGWYDYSLAPGYLNMTKDEYEIKAFGFRRLEDADYIKSSLSDEELVRWNLNLLEKFISEIRESVNDVILALHFAPFKDSLKYTGNPEIDYFSAYMGSQRFGEFALRHNIGLIVHGHTHRSIEYYIGKTKVVSVGLRETELISL
ncbi:metallophosphoesterase family protein [Pyrococcus abyssi]|uniref:Calcineurin-like phosphoesterase domain-containing protein n=1 Tax=Pyrococcus abyssi (strain GE5 / Orsay) TaxID=272844 RepID=Q9V2Q8_PYRAB|nr:metallophosphoesterase [Pyrococcus abyssi]CAB48940.1 Hypothetical protein PAB0011 [Pyrococcus abyssi GE5]CCE69385.1 TPA: hypothetical protein PAB0011 [Pyrococcus abyssi GE5]